MSKFDLPRSDRIARGAARCKAVQAALAKPLAGCEAYCTDASVAAEKPIVVVYQYGYVICGALDYECAVSDLPGGGELIEVRELREGDEWHPEKIIYVYGGNLPQTARRGKLARARTGPPNPTVVREEITFDDTLAEELGIL